MDNALAVPIIAAILLILIAQQLNSFTAVLAKRLKSSENPTLSSVDNWQKANMKLPKRL